MDVLQEYFNVNEFDYEANKKKLIDNLNFLKAMSVEEHTFYKKWREVQDLEDVVAKSVAVKYKIWTPTDINNDQLTISEINSIQPKILHVNNPTLVNDWKMIRIFSHTMEYDQNPGRFVRLLVTDGHPTNPRYIGAVSMASDVIALGYRDTYIGWTEHDKLKKKKLNHSSIGSCIMATQPFGYNFLGGKLMSLLITCETVRNLWKQQYGQTLAGISTTSLYGSYSMYNSLKWWKKCGISTGRMVIKPDQDIYNIWRTWFILNRTQTYADRLTPNEGNTGPVTAPKNKTIGLLLDEVGLKQRNYINGYERGTYYACPFFNSREFLRNEISENELVLNPIYTEQYVIDWWRKKAIARYLNLKQQNNLKPEILYYNQMIGMSYADAKKHYFDEVGR
jgi:hypothetical protein